MYSRIVLSFALHMKIVPSAPQLYGIVERMNYTIMESIRSMLSHFELEKIFWEEAIRKSS